MKIMFHANTLNYRGTTVAITDYARHSREILGLDPIIAYCKTYGNEKDMGNEPAVIEALEKQFEVIGYRAGKLEEKIEQHRVDLIYMIDSGQRKEVPTNAPSAIHAVFQYYEPYGTKYAYISDWLSQFMSRGQTPFVPHIVNLPNPTKNFRKHLGIRDDQIVIGRIGGYYTFDIDFVKKTIQSILSETDQFIFLFVGTEPFYSHSNIKYINEIHDPQKKANFIHSCNGMLHARMRGESFGLSIAEFLSFNKPVLAWNNGHDKNHMEMLKNSGTLYQDELQLKNMLYSFRDLAKREEWSNRVELFQPEYVMQQFKQVFL